MTYRGRAATWLACAALVAGCNEPTPSPIASAPGRVALGPVQRALSAAAGPQAAAAEGIQHSPPVTPARVPDATLDGRILVITADGTDPALAAIVAALGRLGTPFDVLNASTDPPLTTDKLADGSHGRYYAVILDRGTLLVSGPAGTVSAFSNDEWNVLTTYEAAFGVRRAVLYGVPDEQFGFGDPVGVDTTTVPLVLHCTPAGAALFATVNCDNPVSITRAYAYAASALDADTVPLLVDDVGHALAAIRRYPNGRQALLLAFAQNDSLDHTLQLVPGLVHWVTNGLFLGERHAYLGGQIDDLFLASDLYTGGTYRITDADLETFYGWQQGRRARPSTAALRFEFALNGAGATTKGDLLTAKALEIGSAFGWINHTYDHADLTGSTYAATYDEVDRNNLIIAALGLEPYSRLNLVTPNVSGLMNPNALNAFFQLGVRYLVSDTSVVGYKNVPYNQGQTNPLEPGLLMIPRRPTNLFYNVSTPDQWVAEYNAIYFAFWQRNLAYDEILDKESDTLLGYLLTWQSDPLMFHQADCRDYGTGHSLLGDLMDRVLAKYDALVKLPILSPTMDELGGRQQARMTYDAASPALTIGPGAFVTLRAAAAARVPVTGLCTPGSESYGGDHISYVDLQPGVERRFPLDECSTAGADGGSSDSGAPPEAGASTGTGGASGAADARREEAAGDSGAPDAGGRGAGGSTTAVDAGASGTGGATTAADAGGGGAGGATTVVDAGAGGAGGSTVVADGGPELPMIGPLDAATRVFDAGVPQAVPEEGGRLPSAGCSCGVAGLSGSASQPAALSLLSLLVLASRRRRQGGRRAARL